MSIQSGITFVIFLIVSSTALKSYLNYKVYSVHARDESDLNFLRSLDSNFTSLDFWDEVHYTTNTNYRVMVKPDDDEKFVKTLRENKIENVLIIDDVEKVVRNQQKPRKSSRFDFNHFWTFDEVYSYLDYLSTKYSRHVKVSLIGVSGKFRKVRSIQIFGDNYNVTSHKHLLVDATIHAREWISTMVAVYLIYELVENRKQNTKMLSNIDWVIVPIANPDGYVYTHEKDRLWRKTLTELNNRNCFGIDINRNFDYHWKTPGGSSKKPCKEDFRGPAPNHIPEVLNLINFFTKYPNTKLYLTLHSYGGYILYPYGYDTVNVENYAELHKIGLDIRDAILKNSGFKYKVGNSAKLLYAASGASDDYAAGVAKIPYVFTMELPGGGPNGFDIPTSRIRPIAKQTFVGLQVFGSFFGDMEQSN